MLDKRLSARIVARISHGTTRDAPILQGIARDADADMAVQIIDAFLVQCDEQRAQLESALELRSLEQVHRVAHELKLKSLVAGGVALSDLCACIEQLEDGIVPEAYLQELRLCCDELTRALVGVCSFFAPRDP